MQETELEVVVSWLIELYGVDTCKEEASQTQSPGAEQDKLFWLGLNLRDLDNLLGRTVFLSGTIQV